jgi:hypothetical protein
MCDVNTIVEFCFAFESSECRSEEPERETTVHCRGAALLIGFWDLFIHAAALFALIFIFGRATDPRTRMMSMSDPSLDSNQHRSYLSSNLLLTRILEKRNVSRPPMEINARQFYTHMDLMTIKWMRTLSQRRLKTRKTTENDSCLFSFQRTNTLSSSLFSRRRFSFSFICGEC